jgi:Fe-S-cluster containining protein
MNIFRRVKNVNLITITSDEPVEDVPCGDCTACCELLAPHLTPEEISSGRFPLSLTHTPEGPVITLYRKPEGGCGMFVDGRCSIYEERPLACRQFDCRKGHHPKTNEIAMEKFGVNVNEIRKDGVLHNTSE